MAAHHVQRRVILTRLCYLMFYVLLLAALLLLSHLPRRMRGLPADDPMSCHSALSAYAPRHSSHYIGIPDRALAWFRSD